ncbi:uncharacterized protein TNCV_3603151 [Trichonephila clavipes]|nr:uncharacterized protein TNCV_3603151 [Trichonephila clavipes]
MPIPLGYRGRCGSKAPTQVSPSSFGRGRDPSLLVLDKAAVAEWSRYRIVTDLVTCSSPEPLKTFRVGARCTFNLLRAETPSLWCGVVVRRVVPARVSSSSIAKSPRVAEQHEVNTHSLLVRKCGDQLRCYPRYLTENHVRTPELAPSPNYHHTNGRTFQLSTDLTCTNVVHRY